MGALGTALRAALKRLVGVGLVSTHHIYSMLGVASIGGRKLTSELPNASRKGGALEANFTRVAILGDCSLSARKSAEVPLGPYLTAPIYRQGSGSCTRAHEPYL